MRKLEMESDFLKKIVGVWETFVFKNGEKQRKSYNHGNDEQTHNRRTYGIIINGMYNLAWTQG